jgi:polysaccharide pyruvyl transferase WcaK-like protein
MRFHSNLCAIGMGIPSLGLAGHEQISSLYDELGLSARCIRLDDRQFVGKLLDKLNDTLQMLESIKEQYASINIKLNCQADLYYRQLREWLHHRGK